MMREFSAALALSARCHLNHGAALHGPSGRCGTISGWMRSFGTMQQRVSLSKQAARMLSLPEIFVSPASEN
jgi:hypothetical protein